MGKDDKNKKKPQQTVNNSQDILSAFGSAIGAKDTDVMDMPAPQVNGKISESEDILSAFNKTVKKKDIGGESSISSETFLSTGSPSKDEVLNSYNNLQNHKLSEQDFDILSTTQYGKEQGLDKFAPEQKISFINAVNNNSKDDGTRTLKLSEVASPNNGLAPQINLTPQQQAQLKNGYQPTAPIEATRGVEEDVTGAMNRQVQTRTDAINNTLQRKYEMSGQKVEPNSVQYQKDYKDLLKEVQDGDKVVVNAKDGKKFITRSAGFWESFGNTLGESFKAPIESWEINTKDGADLANYLDKKQNEQPYIPTSKTSGIVGTIGEMAGGFPKIAGLFALNTVAPGLGTTAAAAEAEFTSTGQHTAELYQRNLKTLTDAGMPLEQARIEAANKAKQDAPLAAAPDALMTAALGEMGANTGKLTTSAQSFKDVLLKSGKDVSKMAAMGGASEAARSGIEKAQGYDVNMQEVLDNFGKGAYQWATMDAMFKIAPLISKLPSAAQGAWKEYISNTPPVILDNANLPQQQRTEVNQYIAAKKSVEGLVLETVEPVYANLTAEQNALHNEIAALNEKKKTTPTALHGSIDEQIKNKEAEIQSINNKMDELNNGKEIDHTDYLSHPDSETLNKKENEKGNSQKSGGKNEGQTSSQEGTSQGEIAQPENVLNKTGADETKPEQLIDTSAPIKNEITPEQEKFVKGFIVGEGKAHIENVLDRINNAEYINEKELDKAADGLYQLWDKVDNQSLQNLIEPLISKIENYDFRTKTESSTVTEKIPIKVANESRKPTVANKSLTQWEGNRATVTDANGKTIEGQIKSDNGNYGLYDNDGNKVAALGEKAITDRDITLPSKEDTPNPIGFDKDGNVTSLTLQINKPDKEHGGVNPDKKITIQFKDPDKALDYAIQLRAEQVGEVPQPEFELAFKEVEREVQKEVPVKNLSNEAEKKTEITNTKPSEGSGTSNEPLSAEKSGNIESKISETVSTTGKEQSISEEATVKPTDIHKAAKEAGIDYESKDFMAKSKELTGQEHLDNMKPEQLSKVLDYINSKKEGGENAETIRSDKGQVPETRGNEQKLQDKGSEDIQRGNKEKQTELTEVKQQERSEVKSVLQRDIKEVSVEDILSELKAAKNKKGLRTKDLSNATLKSGSKDAIENYVERAKSVLKTLFPDATLETFGSTDEYVKAGGTEDTRGIGLLEKNGKHKILLNLEKIAEDNSGKTAYHEVIHPILYEAYTTEPDKLNTLWNDVANDLKDVKGMDVVLEHAGLYGGNERGMEGLTEFLAQVADGNINLKDAKPSTIQKALDLINKVLEAIGINYKFNNVKDFTEFADKVKQAFQTGDAEILKGEIKGTNIDKVYEQLEKTREQEPDNYDKLTDHLKQKLKDEVDAGNLTQEQADKILEENIGEEKPLGVKHADTDVIRTKHGLEEYERTPEKMDEWDNEAYEKIKKGYNIEKLLGKMEKGHLPDKVEQRIMDRYISALEAELTENPSKENLEKLNRAVQISDKAGGTEIARSLVSRKFNKLSEDTLGQFLIEKQEAQSHPLSEKQIKEQKAKYDELKNAKDELQKELDKKTAQLDKSNAQKEIDKVVKETKKTNKQHEDFVHDRDLLREKLKHQKEKHEAWLKEQGIQQQGFGFTLTTDMVKTIGEIVKSYASEGVKNLEEFVDKVFDDIKEVFPEVTKKDTLDVIAGRYNEREQTRNEKAEELRNLRTEINLLDKIAAVRKGEEPKSETRQREKTRRIEELEEKLKEVKKMRKEKLAQEEDVSEAGGKNDVEKLAAEKKKLIKRIEKLNQDLKDRKFLEEKPQSTEVKLDEKGRKLLDRVVELEKKRQTELERDKYEKTSKWGKRWDKVVQAIGVRRIVQTAIDLSVPFRQGITIVANPRNWFNGVAGKSFGRMFSSTFSSKNFDRIMYSIHHATDYREMTKDGIFFNEIEASDPTKRNEDFQKSWVYKVPYLREPLLASNRAADAFMNVSRFERYQIGKRSLERQGITRENSPEDYQALAKWVMNTTGRGSMIKWLEDSGGAKRFLNNTFYGARLMASRFNLLNPYYYAKMPKSVRVEAMKDMGGFTSSMFITGLALVAAGGTTSFNPNDSDFLKVRFGNKVYDITGGLGGYIKLYLRLAEAVGSRFTADKHEAGKDVERAERSTGTFFSSKLSPNTSYALGAFTGKNAIGQEFNPYDVLKIYPMYVDDMKTAWKEDGLTSLVSVLVPSVFGVGVNIYPSKDTPDDLPTLIKRNVRSDEQDFEKMSKVGVENNQVVENKLSKEEKQEYIKTRDEKITEGVTDMYNNGHYFQSIGKNVPYAEMTTEQRASALTSIKQAATKQTKSELNISP